MSCGPAGRGATGPEVVKSMLVRALASALTGIKVTAVTLRKDLNRIQSPLIRIADDVFPPLSIPAPWP
jgi:hypothetical protein